MAELRRLPSSSVVHHAGDCRRRPGNGRGVRRAQLVEAWRSAPYLHHGDGLSLEETIVDFNLLQRRGKTADLSPTELADLLEYIESL